MTGKISEDSDVDIDASTQFAAVSGGANIAPKSTRIASYIASATLTLIGKTIDAASNTISNLSTAMFAANVVDADVALGANSDTRIATQKAAKAYVDARRLDQAAAPTADVSLNSHKLTNVTDPTNAQDAATKNYVDAVVSGIDAKPSVKAATTANITLSAAQTVDGVSLVAGDRCLVKNQTTAAQNGIYVVASGSWARTADADAWSELPGAFVIVEQGSVNADTGWLCTVDAGGTLGTTSVAFVQFGNVVAYTAGAGLKLTGAQFSVDIDGASAAAAVSDTDEILVYQGANPLKQAFSAIKTWAQGFLVSGPASAVTARIATFNGTSGRSIQDGGAVISTDGTFASNVDTKVPTEKAVKTYADAIGAGVTSVTPTIGNTGGGSFGSASASGKYIQVGKLVIFNFAATVTTVGTASGLVTLTLPVAPATPQNTAGIGKELALNNKSVTAELTTGVNNLLRLYFYDANSTLVAGSTVVGSITYFAA